MDVNEISTLAGQPGTRRWHTTVDDYYCMAEHGILKDTDRVELIEGEVVWMAPIGCDHSGVVDFLNDKLSSASFGRAIVRVQSPLRLDNGNEPEPDIQLLQRRADFYRSAHPTPADAYLVIEVADSSLEFDRGIKVPLYAAHGIPEVWIVNLKDSVVEVFRDPVDGEYRKKPVFGPGQKLQSDAIEGVSFDVSELFSS